MYKAYKYRIYPTKDQKYTIDKTLSICRLVYNLALEVKISAWKAKQINITAFDLMRQFTELRREYNWMKEASGSAVYSRIYNIDAAFKGFFKGNGYPQFKKKRGTQSYQERNGRRRLDWDKGLLTLPRIKDIPIKLSRRFEGEIRTITISRTATGKYYASILVKMDLMSPEPPDVAADSAVGIDIGLHSYAITSDGRFMQPNRNLEKSLQRLKCLQRRVTNKKKGSNNRIKALRRVAILHEQISNQRYDYIHKTTTYIVRDNQATTFVIEDLNVSGMLKNQNISKAIQDASFYEFSRQMKYKCEWYGKNLINIDQFAPSSKRCSDCGEINQNLTLADREWTCVCGCHHDRDLNAAKNIKWFGLQQTIFKNTTPEGIGEGPVESRRLRRAKKQEAET